MPVRKCSSTEDNVMLKNLANPIQLDMDLMKLDLDTMVKILNKDLLYGENVLILDLG
jgi:hypothetical protein